MFYVINQVINNILNDYENNKSPLNGYISKNLLYLPSLSQSYISTLIDLKDKKSILETLCGYKFCAVFISCVASHLCARDHDNGCTVYALLSPHAALKIETKKKK